MSGFAGSRPLGKRFCRRGPLAVARSAVLAVARSGAGRALDGPTDAAAGGPYSSEDVAQMLMPLSTA